ncbi:MAG: nitrous oxide reductase accessory protein NosL [Ignavibacteriaceae bacterium]|nr:nitrous oxide reductase accessory protein NosL [Ignavibacteriaceae bacterium]
MKSLFILVLSAFILFGCSDGPGEIVTGFDNCDNCRMKINNDRFYAGILTTKGKFLKYDSIECAVASILEGTVKDVKTVYVADFNGSGLIDAETAVFVKSTKVKSPMGLNAPAFINESDAVKTLKDETVNPVNFSKLKEIVKTEWM